MPSKGFKKRYCPKYHDTFNTGRTQRGRCKICAYDDITNYGSRRFYENLWSLKMNPCTDCKQWFNPWQMQFDHLPSFNKTKSFNTCYSLRKVFKELQKCQLVCSNCHWDRTHLRKMRYKVDL